MADKSLAEMLVDGDPELTGRKPEMKPAAESDDSEIDEGQLLAAEEAMSAVQSGDAKAFAEALKAFFDLV